MPIIRVEMFEGRRLDQKRACAEALTKVWCGTCGGTPQMATVAFTDLAKHDWATAGRLASVPKV